MIQLTVKKSKRDVYLRQKYGISQAQYLSLIRKQNGLCPVCRRSFSDIGRRPHVDHDHKTGEIRGILCAYCNHRVVGRHTSPALLRSAADYLELPRIGWIVPKKRKR